MADYRSDEIRTEASKKPSSESPLSTWSCSVGLLLAAMFQSKKQVDTVVWMNPGSFGGDSVPAESQATPRPGHHRRPQANRHDRRSEQESPNRKRIAGSTTADPADRSSDPTAHSLGAALVQPSDLPIFNAWSDPDADCNSDAATYESNQLPRPLRNRRLNRHRSRLRKRRPSLPQAYAETDAQSDTRSFGDAKILPKRRGRIEREDEGKTEREGKGRG